MQKKPQICQHLHSSHVKHFTDGNMVMEVSNQEDHFLFTCTCYYALVILAAHESRHIQYKYLYCSM